MHATMKERAEKSAEADGAKVADLFAKLKEFLVEQVKKVLEAVGGDESDTRSVFESEPAAELLLNSL